MELPGAEALRIDHFLRLYRPQPGPEDPGHDILPAEAGGFFNIFQPVTFSFSIKAASFRMQDRVAWVFRPRLEWRCITS